MLKEIVLSIIRVNDQSSKEQTIAKCTDTRYLLTRMQSSCRKGGLVKGEGG